MKDLHALPNTIDRLGLIEAEILASETRMAKLEECKRSFTTLFHAGVAEIEAAWRVANTQLHEQKAQRATVFAEVEGLLS